MQKRISSSSRGSRDGAGLVEGHATCMSDVIVFIEQEGPSASRAAPERRDGIRVLRAPGTVASAGENDPSSDEGSQRDATHDQAS